MDYTIKLPNFPYKVGDKVLRNNEKMYIAEIMFVMSDFDWLILAHIVDDNDIIQKTVTIPYKIFFPESMLNNSK